ncbi:MAG: sigma-54 dependent transcriptional regulator [Thermodesulfobacteriota bacterium]|nr:sigma-54 dependent transcriptional regulator [Thermodesulfobacteriota bacterium]
MNNKKVLVVDDERGMRDLFVNILAEEGYNVTTAEDGQQAIELLESENFDIVLTDLKMPKVDGIKVIERLKSVNYGGVGIVITGFGSIKSAISAMKAGAYEYITKPINVDEVLLTLKRALEYQKLRHENALMSRQLKRKYRFENIVGDSEPMHEVFRLIEAVADSDSTILIYGSSGTGKELAARALHYNSRRCNKPLIPVNCGAIPEDLLESELFGHVKGAFTGASAARPGRFELANGGTIFLDEISEMSPALQVKLLRVLQQREFERVGGTQTIKVDIRVIAATNQNLEDMVRKKTFREDLFYRLNVIPIYLPPLKGRKLDIPLLVSHFVEKFNREKGRDLKGFTDEALECLIKYDWPGNIRELENLIERMVILKGQEMVLPSDLPEKITDPTAKDLNLNMEFPEDGICFSTAVNEFEKRLILQALSKANGVKSKAAKLLNINRTTLVEKIRRNQLEEEKSL